MKFTSSLKLKLIYVFRINDAAHKGCLKVGETTCDDKTVFGLEPNSRPLKIAAKKRINEYTQTAGISYDLLYTEMTIYNKGGLCSFNDKEVHDVLIRSGIKRKIFDKTNKANEWFVTDLETVKRAIAAVKEGRTSLNAAEISHDKSPIVFRPEQKDAIEKTEKQFKKGNQMLWNAKMRFGKTLSALQVVRDMEFERTLILTHRPVVDKGWFEDFGKIFYDRPDYSYGSKNYGSRDGACTVSPNGTVSPNNTASSNNGVHNKTNASGGCGDGACTVSTEEYGKHKFVYFASMQDLRGAETVGGNFDKDKDIFATPWDLIIVDEAHEGTQTALGKAVMKVLTKEDTKVLRLSGTPFNLLDDFKEDEIYTWDYVMEQRAKSSWDKTHFGDPNPYAPLPCLNIYTYDLGRLLHDYIDEDVAFNFHEFFRVNEAGSFVHEQDIQAFLNLLSKDDKDSLYPFSNDEYRRNFRHTLWMIPGVKEARALSALLQRHEVFQHFQIVNVAGDGDEEEESKEALKAVEDAIGSNPEDTYTITLSCGRLTTGVSVKAWTAVLMLSGSYSTSASSYMQTIFRVQTPATINGRTKEECYVFDFAPDRTLKVIAETAKISAKAGKTSEKDRDIMGEFLNFCPIISVEGSQMKPYDVPKMLEQLKKVYIERVVNNGFEDGYLYNDELMKLNDVDLNEFKELKGIIGSTKAMAKSNDIDLNNQGFTDEQYEQAEKAEKKEHSKKDLTDEEKKLLEERTKKRKQRQDAISILRGISIRMPLMIYGAEVGNEDEDITIDNFTSLIDPQSWTEFMPKGVSKQIFNNFKKYYDPEIFCAAGKRIRAMARAADKLSIEERIKRITTIFRTFRNPDKETVLTPWRVVNMHMGDCLGGYKFYDDNNEEILEQPQFIDRGDVTANVFNPQSRILEINSKSGLYPLYVAYSIYRSRVETVHAPSPQSSLPSSQPSSSSPLPPSPNGKCLITDETMRASSLQLWDKTVRDNIFVICKTQMAKSITKRTLVGFRDAKVNTRYFEDLINQITNKPQQFIEKVRNGKTYWKTNNDEYMKFNAIVGNPPYQLTGAAGGNNDAPVYQNFGLIASKMTNQYVSLILKANWMSPTGGRDNLLKDFRQHLLNGGHTKMLVLFPNNKEVFNNVEIKGGICYYLEDVQNKYPSCEYYIIENKVRKNDLRNLAMLDTFVRNPECNSIVCKVEKIRKAQGVDTVDKIISNDTPFGIPSNPKTSPKNPINVYTTDSENHDVLLYHIENQKRKIEYVSIADIRKNAKDIDKIKVFVTYSGGSGNDAIILGQPILAPKHSVCSQSFLYSVFNTEQEGYNFIRYIKSKFFRILVSAIKITQSAPNRVYQFVPLQDFTSNSDIDWNKSVSDIDRQLYAKYGLTEEETSFIEGMIKAME